MTEMRYGYARVSAEDQHPDLQFRSLAEYGCEAIFSDHGISDTRIERPGLQAVLRAVQSGDTFVVWRLDRLGRSVMHLLELFGQFHERGVRVVSLTECIDTMSPGGQLTFHMLAALAGFERAVIAGRSRAGMVAARRRGSHIGRPKALTCEQVEQARALMHASSLEDVARHFEIHPQTLRRYLRLAGDDGGVKRAGR